MSAHAESLKLLLVQSIAGTHPERPSDITDDQYRACRAFLANFIGSARRGQRDLRGKLYSLNYDLLLYWSLLHIEPEQQEGLSADDGFRSPSDNWNAPYVSWEAEGAADSQSVHFLHGALHLFDLGPELQKKCWERAGNVPIVEQIRAALDEDMFPLFVAEGTCNSKLTRIRHSGYLQRSLKSFAQVMRSAEASLFIYGHSLAANDDHVLRFIEKGKLGKLFVSFHGDSNNDTNQKMFRRAIRLSEQRGDRFPLEVYFFDAIQASVWA